MFSSGIAYATAVTASSVTYSNTTSKLSSTNVHGAVDALLIKTKATLIGTKKLIGKANSSSITSYESGNKSEMYTFTHATTSQTSALTDYRYIGNVPKNYVSFNNEVWRIIGVFTVDGERRIKIVRNEQLSTEIAWDSANKNEWTTSTLNTYLNGSYGTYQASLTSAARSQIAASTYYLGGSTTHKNLGGEDYYKFERGTTVYSSSRSTKTSNYFAVMYPSDYVYTYANGVDATCYSNAFGCNTSSGIANSWLYKGKSEWLLSPYASSSIYAFRIYPSGVIYYNDIVNAKGVRPTVYLKSSVKIISGDGSSSSPYTLE